MYIDDIIHGVIHQPPFFKILHNLKGFRVGDLLPFFDHLLVIQIRNLVEDDIDGDNSKIVITWMMFKVSTFSGQHLPVVVLVLVIIGHRKFYGEHGKRLPVARNDDVTSLLLACITRR